MAGAGMIRGFRLWMGLSLIEVQKPVRFGVRKLKGGEGTSFYPRNGTILSSVGDALTNLGALNFPGTQAIPTQMRHYRRLHCR